MLIAILFASSSIFMACSDNGNESNSADNASDHANNNTNQEENNKEENADIPEEVIKIADAIRLNQKI